MQRPESLGELPQESGSKLQIKANKTLQLTPSRAVLLSHDRLSSPSTLTPRVQRLIGVAELGVRLLRK
jgi:hypothetical protein